LVDRAGVVNGNRDVAEQRPASTGTSSGGLDQERFETVDMSEQSSFVGVAKRTELADGGRLSVDVDGRAVLLFRIGEEIYAVEDVCTHDGQPLTDGEFSNGEIECPRHGARFDVRSGRALCMPAVEPVRVFRVRVVNDLIEVESPTD